MMKIILVDDSVVYGDVNLSDGIQETINNVYRYMETSNALVINNFQHSGFNTAIIPCQNIKLIEFLDDDEETDEKSCYVE